MKNKPG